MKKEKEVKEMDESRLDKMEDMLATLITMVGNMNSRLEDSIAKQSKMSERLDSMEESFNGKFKRIDEKFEKIDEKFEKIDEKFERIDKKFEKLDEKMDKFQEDQRSMRREIMEKLIVIQADQDHIWEKTVRNEREIAKLKIHLQA